MTSTKPFDIPKALVWNAYLAVKASKGGPGIDGICMDVFEQNLKDRLYKIWNRLSSGSYFPAPVKQVDIPKADGGTRSLVSVHSGIQLPTSFWSAISYPSRSSLSRRTPRQITIIPGGGSVARLR